MGNVACGACCDTRTDNNPLERHIMLGEVQTVPANRVHKRAEGLERLRYSEAYDLDALRASQSGNVGIYDYNNPALLRAQELRIKGAPLGPTTVLRGPPGAPGT
jgi:hypothetical protein